MKRIATRLGLLPVSAAGPIGLTVAGSMALVIPKDRLPRKAEAAASGRDDDRLPR